jgi:hypothetical protein
MYKPTTRIALSAIMLAAASLFGCQNSGGSSTAAAPNAPTPQAAPTAVPSATDSTRLISGAAPLNFVLGGGGPIHVVDVATGKTIAKATAAPQSVIIVDDAKGITVANTVIKAGPLTPGHQYEIWLEHQ